MNSAILEECSSCMRILIFRSEQERQEALLDTVGEILCPECSQGEW